MYIGEDLFSFGLESRQVLQRISLGENAGHLPYNQEMFVHQVRKVEGLCELSSSLKHMQGKAKDSLRGEEWMGSLYFFKYMYILPCKQSEAPVLMT